MARAATKEIFATLLKLIFSPFKFMKFCADLENDLIFVFFSQLKF